MSRQSNLTQNRNVNAVFLAKIPSAASWPGVLSFPTVEHLAIIDIDCPEYFPLCETQTQSDAKETMLPKPPLCERRRLKRRFEQWHKPNRGKRNYLYNQKNESAEVPRACPLTRRQRPCGAKLLPHRFYHLMSTRVVVWPFISLSELSQHNKVRLRLGAMWHGHTRVGPSSSINLTPSKSLPPFRQKPKGSCWDLSCHRLKKQ